MSAALDLFDAEVTGIVQRRLALGLDKRQLVKNRVAIACSVE